MSPFFQRLLTPTPTVPLPRGGLFNDKRPWRSQVASGFRHAVGLIAGFSVILLAIAGLAWWSGQPIDERAPGKFLVGWWTLPLAVIIMLLTAHRWAPFATAFFFGPGVWRAFGQLIAGPISNSPIIWVRTPRVEAAELLLFSASVIALTWRFLRRRPAPTTFLDRCAFTFFAIATLEQMFVPYRFPPAPMLSGVAALFVAWVAYHLQRAKHRHKHHPHSVGALET